MTTRREIVEKALTGLCVVEKRLWRFAARLLESEQLEHHESYALRVLRSAAACAQLKEDLWDLEPDLAGTELLETSSVDPTLAIEAWTREEPVRQHDLQRILQHAPESVAAQTQNAPSDAERARILQEWWKNEERPFAPADRLDRELDGRRWRRVQAARALERRLGVELIDPATGDVDPEKVARWRTTRNVVRIPNKDSDPT